MNRKRRRPYQYSPKQVNYYLKITKDIQKLKVWQRKDKQLKIRIIKDLNRLKTSSEKLKRENYRLKAEKRVQERAKWAQKQGIQINQTYDGRLQQKAQEQLKKIERTMQNTTPIINYLKPNTISQIRKNYTGFTADEKSIYSELLDKAMQNPKEFKAEIIDQIDKLKNQIEIEMIIYGNYKGNIIEKAGMTTRGKTIEEIKQLMAEYGIRNGTTLISEQWRNFTSAAGAGNWKYDQLDTTITEMEFRIRLIRGK